MDFIRQNSIEFVDCKVTDLHGRWKHLTIPAQRFNESIMEQMASTFKSNPLPMHRDFVIKQFTEARIN